MLYIISGASRAGKSIVAKRISKIKNIPYLSLDWIMMGFTNGVPEFGIHDKLFPDEIAEKMWRFLKAMMESMLYTETDCIIEGEALLPDLIKELLVNHPEDIRVCFLGFTDIDVNKKFKEIKSFSDAKNDWLIKESDDYIMDHIQNMIDYSKKIEKLCHGHGITYFDTSLNFNRALDEVLAYMA